MRDYDIIIFLINNDISQILRDKEHKFMSKYFKPSSFPLN